MSKKVVLAGACRTAIGTMGGTLSTTPAVDLGAIVIKNALERAGVPADQVDHVYMGCVIQAGLGQNVARQASLKAGLPIEAPAVTVNVVCGSGLNCVNLAAQMIQAGGYRCCRWYGKYEHGALCADAGPLRLPHGPCAGSGYNDQRCALGCIQ